VEVSYQEDTFDWQALTEVDRWLDNDVPGEYREQPLAQDWARISKVIEELGEAVNAMIGFTGQNPRKGTTHTRDDMLYELADVTMTSVLAILHFTKNDAEAREILRRKQEFIYRRMRDGA
jgi:NTP pyrophosphatase (non-canonical NTP hydrolase)